MTCTETAFLHVEKWPQYEPCLSQNLSLFLSLVGSDSLRKAHPCLSRERAINVHSKTYILLPRYRVQTISVSCTHYLRILLTNFFPLHRSHSYHYILRMPGLTACEVVHVF